MSIPFSTLALFSISCLLGIVMLIEGFIIIKTQKQFIPLPSRVLYWIGVGLFGREKSAQKFTKKATPENLHTYAVFVLIFGACLVISSGIYLNAVLT